MMDYLTLYAPTPQNGHRHSNNSLANCMSVFNHFGGLALKGLTMLLWESVYVALATFALYVFIIIHVKNKSPMLMKLVGS